MIQGFSTPSLCVQITQINLWAKTSPGAWFDKLSKFLIQFGFCCSSVDSSLFILRENSIIIIMLIYVDDIVIT